MPFRVLTAEISHETNTFNVRPTDLQAFRDRYLLDGPAALATRGDANTELAGLLDVARLHGWDMTHAGSAAAGPGGRVTDEAFDGLCAPLLDAAGRGGWDGVLLMLHGAMVTASHDDGEGEILRRLRAVIGPDLPVAVTLDPHANVSPEMCARAQILVSYTTYPHVDIRATGRRVAELLHRTMAGEVRPATLLAHRPMLEEANGGRTDLGPMIERHALARAAEARPDILAVSINGAFPCADVAFVGPTVLVTHDLSKSGPGDPRAVAEEIADDIWARRGEALDTYLTVAEAAAIAATWAGGSPLVIADYADNPGSGAYGDSTNLLAALLEAGVANACFGPMIDARAARTLQSRTVGETVTLSLGGRTAPGFGGGPLEVTGVLRWRGEGLVTGTGPILGGQRRSFGATAVLEVAGIDVLIVSIAHQMLDLAQFETFGIDPRTRACIALRSMQHFRAAFAPIAGRIVLCDSGALCTVNYALLTYRHARRPIHPLDDMR
jgi:microcystin degradation protein MlrC